MVKSRDKNIKCTEHEHAVVLWYLLHTLSPRFTEIQDVTDPVLDAGGRRVWGELACTVVHLQNMLIERIEKIEKQKLNPIKRKKKLIKIIEDGGFPCSGQG